MNDLSGETAVSIHVGDRVGSVSGLLLRPREAWALYVMGHGAGAGMRHRFMEQAARRARKMTGGKRLGKLDPEESAVLVLLQRRLQTEAKKQKAPTRRRKAA